MVVRTSKSLVEVRNRFSSEAYWVRRCWNEDMVLNFLTARHDLQGTLECCNACGMYAGVIKTDKMTSCHRLPEVNIQHIIEIHISRLKIILEDSFSIHHGSQN